MSCTLIGIYWLVAGLVIGIVIGTFIGGDSNGVETCEQPDQTENPD